MTMSVYIPLFYIYVSQAGFEVDLAPQPNDFLAYPLDHGPDPVSAYMRFLQVKYFRVSPIFHEGFKHMVYPEIAAAGSQFPI